MRYLPGAGELSVYGQTVSCFCGGGEQGTISMPLQRRGLVSRQGSPVVCADWYLFTELHPFSASRAQLRCKNLQIKVLTFLAGSLSWEIPKIPLL